MFSHIINLLLYIGLYLFFHTKAVNATALTYKVEANENACFFVWNDQPGKKIGFYFAVTIPPYFVN